MIKIRIHIKSESIFMDDRVFTDIELPAVPRIGETLYIEKKQTDELESMAKKSLVIAKYYSPEWFYGKSYNCKDPKEDNLNHLSFVDAITVVNVAYYANSDIVHIELGVTIEP